MIKRHRLVSLAGRQGGINIKQGPHKNRKTTCEGSHENFTFLQKIRPEEGRRPDQRKGELGKKKQKIQGKREKEGREKKGTLTRGDGLASFISVVSRTLHFVSRILITSCFLKHRSRCHIFFDTLKSCFTKWRAPIYYGSHRRT